MGADRFTLTMYLALGTEKGISTSTREDRVSDETVFREARSVMSLNKKKKIFSKFFWSDRKQNNSRYSSSHWKYPTELCEYKLKLRWNTCLCHKITIYDSTSVVKSQFIILKPCLILSGEVRVFQRRRFSEGQDRTENDWRCRAPRQTQPWRHHHWTDIGKYWSVSLPCSLLFSSKIPSWWKWIWTFKLN